MSTWHCRANASRLKDGFVLPVGTELSRDLRIVYMPIEVIAPKASCCDISEDPSAAWT